MEIYNVNDSNDEKLKKLRIYLLSLIQDKTRVNSNHKKIKFALPLIRQTIHKSNLIEIAVRIN